MKHALVLGGTSNFGLYLSEVLSQRDYRTVALGRPQVDFSGGWLPAVEVALKTAFTDTANVDLIVVNVFDKNPDALDTQLRVLSYMWGLYKNNPRTTVVALGSMEHYYTSSPVAKAKRELKNYVFESLSTQDANAKFLLVEPFRLSQLGSKDTMSYRTLVDRLLAFVDLNVTFLTVSLKDLPQES